MTTTIITPDAGFDDPKEGGRKYPLPYALLQPVNDPWERKVLSEMCEKHRYWKNFAAEYIDRGYLLSMRPDTTARVAILAVVDPEPVEQPELEDRQMEETPESTSMARRGTSR